MHSGAGHNRRGAKARKLIKQPTGMSPSSEFPQESSPRRSNTHGQHGQTHLKQAIQPARSTPPWAEAIGRPHAEQQLVPHRTPTYHTMAKDAGYHYPLKTLPHLNFPGRYSGSTLPWNEMVFRNVYPAGQATRRELLHSHRTAAHIAIRKRLGINRMHTDAQGDIITVVTKKTDKQQGE